MNGGIDSAISHSGYSTTVSKANWNLEELIFFRGKKFEKPGRKRPAGTRAETNNKLKILFSRAAPSLFDGPGQATSILKHLETKSFKFVPRNPPSTSHTQ